MKYIEIDGIRSDVPDCLFCPCYERDEDKGWCHHLLRRGMPIDEYVDGVAEFCPLREEQRKRRERDGCSTKSTKENVDEYAEQLNSERKEREV